MARSVRQSPILGAVSSMIGEASDTLVTDGGRFRHSFEVALNLVGPDPAQPRKLFEAAEITALAATMAEQGQLQPILLRRDPAARGRWIIVAGERRWRAALHNSWPAILAIEHAGDPEVAALVENLQRVDLSPLEEARGLQRLIAGKGWSQDEAATRLGKHKSDISATLRILSLPQDLLDAVVTSQPRPPKSVLVELARIEDPQALRHLGRLLRAGTLTVRAVREARPAGPPAPFSPAPLSLALAPPDPVPRPLPELGRVIAALEKLQGSDTMLTEQDRLSLHHLRAVVNALLGL